MKYFKVFSSLILIALVTLVSVAAFADDVVPGTGESLISLINAIKVGGIGAILLAIGQLLKSDLVVKIIGAKVNSKTLPWITSITGAIISVGTSIVQGQPWYIGLIEGLIAGLIANGVFDHTKAVTA